MNFECDKCGSTDGVKTFYGYETCDPNEPWMACWDCRWPYIQARVDGVGEDETDQQSTQAAGSGQQSLDDFL